MGTKLCDKETNKTYSIVIHIATLNVCIQLLGDFTSVVSEYHLAINVLGAHVEQNVCLLYLCTVNTGATPGVQIRVPETTKL